MITARIQGLDKVNAAIAKFPQAIESVNKLAGLDAGNNILKEPGLRTYPPGTARNQAGREKNGRPQGFYIRGRGYMSPQAGGYKLNPSSEKYGTKWYIKSSGKSTLVGNPTTYAQYLAGDYQPAWAKEVGWKNLLDVAKQKLDETVRIYERHIDAAIKRLGL